MNTTTPPSANPGDNLSELVGQPLVPLRESWRDSRQAAALDVARVLDAEDPDRYWEWAAGHLRWSQPWQTVREGGFGDLRYFCGGELNVADNCVDRHAEDPDRSGRAAVIWEGEPGDVRTLTYRQLRDEVAALARGLLELGVERGDVVALYLQNVPEAFTAVHACNRIGAIYTVLFAGFSPDAVALRLRASRAKVVVVTDVSYRRGREIPLLANLRLARADSPTVVRTVVVDRSGHAPVLEPGEVAYAELLSKYSGEGASVQPLEANDPAFLIFTSGTESKPKGLVHSVGGFLLGAWANVKWQVGLAEDDVYWCAADVGWLTFPIHAVIGGLAHGATLVCYEGSLDAPSPARFYEIARRHGVTKILTAPTAIRMLRAAGDELAAEHPMPDLRLVTVQGEPLDVPTFEWASSRLGGGVPVVNGYGQTETGSTWAYPVYGVDDLKAGSCGRPVPGHRYEIVDDDGEPVPAGTRGNLLLTCPFPTLARTIWDDHQRYLEVYFSKFPGRYWTADEAVADPDGHLWVLGRADDVINVAGHRISTVEIEAAVISHPAVAEGAVIGVSDPVKGMVPVAFVCLRSDAGPADGVRAEVKARVQAAIGGIARLDDVYVTGALPKTRAGKVMRRLLREIVEFGQARGDTTGLEDPETLQKVTMAVRSATLSKGR